MALNYTTLQALINAKYLPVLYNNIFTDNHYLLARLKQQAKTYDERKIVVPLEYGKHTTFAFLGRYGTIALTPAEIVTAAEFGPKMMTGSLSICLEDELENKSGQAIKNILDTKMSNLQRSMQEGLASHIWTRGSALTGTTVYNTIDYLVNDSTSENVGNIITTGTVPEWWHSKRINLTTDPFYESGDSTSEADLLNPSSPVYLKKLLQRGFAKAKYQTGEKPTDIVVPQYIFDMLETILDPQKTGNKFNERAGSMGFTSLDYRQCAIVPDDDMVAAQTGDDDGYMAFFNLNYMQMFFNSGAKFTTGEFTKAANQNAKSSLVNAYGNLTISNRRCQVILENVHSPKSYAA